MLPLKSCSTGIGKHLLSIIYRRLNNREETQDIVQDIFIYIWNSRASLSVRTGLEPYLFTAAKNQLYTLYRRNKLRLVNEEQLRYRASGSANTDELVLFKEVDRLVQTNWKRCQIMFADVLPLVGKKAKVSVRLPVNSCFQKNS